MSETCRVLYQINLRSSAFLWLSLQEQFVLSANSYMFRYQSGILSEFNPTRLRVHTFRLLRTWIETSDKVA